MIFFFYFRTPPTSYNLAGIKDRIKMRISNITETYRAHSNVSYIFSDWNFLKNSDRIFWRFLIGKTQTQVILLTKGMDYGRQMKPFFIKFPKVLTWADKFWGIWGIFGSRFGTVSPLSMFFINEPLFLQKTKSLYPNPKYLFGIGM